MKHYPVNLVITNQPVFIVGGGTVAERKLEKFIGTGAILTVISPVITEKIKLAVDAKQVTWKKKYFSKDDIASAFIVVAATNCRATNEEIYHCCSSNQLINVVDNLELSNFTVPSTLYRGKLSISVSSSGASPGLAKKIVHELSEQYDASYEEYVHFLGECRTKVLEEISDAQVRRKIFKQLLDADFYELTKNRFFEERELLFQKLLDNGGE